MKKNRLKKAIFAFTALSLTAFLVSKRRKNHFPEHQTLAEKLQYLEAKATDAELGLTYTNRKTVFRLWAPSAASVKVKLYLTGDSEQKEVYRTIPMTYRKNVWTATRYGDLQGLFYSYELTIAGETHEVVDLYAKAVGLDGNRGAIIDLQATDPLGWDSDQHVSQKAITDAFIWEMHVADFSSDPNSGISAENRGKYLAFTEKRTTLRNEGQIPTGVAHLRSLGVNYVHLLPVFDFDNDELGKAYNWGYDPKNYQVPEGRYSSDPTNPSTRILEFKQMVQALHEEKIGVVLDVVLNHTSKTADSWFNLTVPDYYYRQDAAGNFADGSGCGNETASERMMMRRYMIDTIIYWAKEYHLDGFRFDLMGLHDVATMNAIRAALDEQGLAHVILYGEPWDAGSNQISAPNIPANKAHVLELSERIAVFNDDFRDGVKGSVFDHQAAAFVQGMNGISQGKLDENLLTALTGNCLPQTQNASVWAKAPSQVINYISAHDNLTLWDKLVASTSNQSQVLDYGFDLDRLNMNKLAAGCLFLSQGAVFMQGGEEFGRTKLGDDNSHRSSISINQLDWQWLEEFHELNEYYRGLAQIRATYPPLRTSNIETAKQTAFSDDGIENLITYVIPNRGATAWRQLAVVLNATRQEQNVQLKTADSTQWIIIANQKTAGVLPLGTITGAQITVPPQSLLVLVEN